jgi:GNAT superfamily N-acetyltransferase
MPIAYLADYPEYVSTVAAWVHGQWGHLVPARTLAQVEAKFRTHLNRARAPLTLLALQEDAARGSRTPAGTASIYLQDMATRPELTPWMAAVYVAPEFRGQGIGSQLVQAIEAQARTLGIARLYLYTPDQEHLYARLGWVTQEHTTHYGEAVVIMTRELIA